MKELKNTNETYPLMQLIGTIIRELRQACHLSREYFDELNICKKTTEKRLENGESVTIFTLISMIQGLCYKAQDRVSDEQLGLSLCSFLFKTLLKLIKDEELKAKIEELAIACIKDLRAEYNAKSAKK